jgi:hypothetical protein
MFSGFVILFIFSSFSVLATLGVPRSPSLRGAAKLIAPPPGSDVLDLVEEKD